MVYAAQNAPERIHMLFTVPCGEIQMELNSSEPPGRQAWTHVEIAAETVCYLICTIDNEAPSPRWFLVAALGTLIDFLNDNETYGKVASIRCISSKSPGAVEPRSFAVRGWECGVVMYPENGPEFTHRLGLRSPCDADVVTPHQPNTEVRPQPGDER